MKIGLKLTLTFFVIAASAVIVVGFLAYNKARISLRHESFNKLTAVREMKATQIEEYYRGIVDQLLNAAEDPTTIRALKTFSKGFYTYTEDKAWNSDSVNSRDMQLATYLTLHYMQKMGGHKLNVLKDDLHLSELTPARMLQHTYIVANPYPEGQRHKMNKVSDTLPYSKAHSRYHPVFRKFMETFGFHDIMLVDTNGVIVYSVHKEIDFGTSLEDGPFRNTNVGDVYRKARYALKQGQYHLVDYAPYPPAFNEPAAFIGSPVIENGKNLGVLIFHMPVERINNVMTSNRRWESVGLGKSGETYIVGSDFLMRNYSRFFIEDSTHFFDAVTRGGVSKDTIALMRRYHTTIDLMPVKTLGTTAALKGESGEQIFNDYRGVSVLSSYKPLNIDGVKWVILSEIDEEEAFAHITELRNRIIAVFAVMTVLLIVVSRYTARRITKPVKELTYDAQQLAGGNFDVEIKIDSHDEIGVLAGSFRAMQQSIRKLIGDLKEINQNLEVKVEERTREITVQKHMVEEKNKEILDSIAYALRLQKAILPDAAQLKQPFNDSFVLFKPRDIVSGDFYWIFKDGDDVLVAVVDCTGHGVPGAMVSVVGASSLNRCVREFGLRKPNEILDKLAVIVEEAFTTDEHEVRDGMDLSLIRVNTKTLQLEYAGANNPLWIIRKDVDEVEEIKADKQPIGKYEYRKHFTNHVIQLKADDVVYLFSDGYADQFGGPKGKKFKYKTLQQLLVNSRALTMADQEAVLRQQFRDWKGELEQVDDVCIVGIKL